MTGVLSVLFACYGGRGGGAGGRDKGEGEEEDCGNLTWIMHCMIFIWNLELARPVNCNRSGPSWLLLAAQRYVPSGRVMWALNLHKMKAMFS